LAYVREVALELLLVPELAEAAVVVGGSGRGVVPGHGAAAAAALLTPWGW